MTKPHPPRMGFGKLSLNGCGEWLETGKLVFHLRPVADIDRVRQIADMGKRSGVSHTDDELDRLSGEELQAELDRSRLRFTIAPSAKVAKQWLKRINWLEAAAARRG